MGRQGRQMIGLELMVLAVAVATSACDKRRPAETRGGVRSPRRVVQVPVPEAAIDTGATIDVGGLGELPDVGGLLRSPKGEFFLQDDSEAPPLRRLTAIVQGTYQSGVEVGHKTGERSGDDGRISSGGSRTAQAKCLALADTARQLDWLAKATRMTCFLSKLDRPGLGALRRVAGADVDSGDVFAANAADVVRVVEMSGVGASGSDRERSDQSRETSEPSRRVVVQVRGRAADPGAYSAVVTVCGRDGVAESTEKIHVDNRAGIYAIDAAQLATRMRGGQTVSTRLRGLVHGYLQRDGGSLAFDESRQRTWRVEAARDEGATSERLNGELTLGADGAMLKTFADVVVGLGPKRLLRSHKSVASLHLTGGEGLATTAVAEGAVAVAGRRTPADGSMRAWAATVAFAYDPTASPRYMTIDASPALDAVTGVDLGTSGALLAQSEPGEPALDLLADGPCGIAPESVFVVDEERQSQAIAVARAACDPPFDDVEQLCTMDDGPRDESPKPRRRASRP